MTIVSYFRPRWSFNVRASSNSVFQVRGDSCSFWVGELGRSFLDQQVALPGGNPQVTRRLIYYWVAVPHENKLPSLQGRNYGLSHTVLSYTTTDSRHKEAALNNFRLTKRSQQQEVMSEKVLNPNEEYLSSEDVQAFNEAFHDIVSDMEQYLGKDVPCEVSRWLRKVLEYNCPHGKKNRGLSVVVTYKLLAEPAELTPERVKLACILGWCIELLQAFFLVSDDIMDRSLTRRGRPCWYKQESVGLMAVNDAILIESTVYYILKKYFQDLKCYNNILDLFREITLKTSCGQCLDMLSAPEGKRINIKTFTPKQYAHIVRLKTSYFSFCLPVQSGMFLAGCNDPEVHEQAIAILLRIGQLFQVQDDYLDCYGDPSITGKIGTDIQDGKCAWLIVRALEMASSAQQIALEENYGVQDEACIQKVKALYEELNLLKAYRRYEDDSCEEIFTMLDKTHNLKVPQGVFKFFMSKLYKRER